MNKLKALTDTIRAKKPSLPTIPKWKTWLDLASFQKWLGQRRSELEPKAKNSIRSNAFASPVAPVPEADRKRSFNFDFVRWFDFERYFRPEWIFDNLYFILFVGALTLFYIANTHRAVQVIRKINKIERELKELRWEHTTLKSELMFQSKQSEVAKRVQSIGLKDLTAPPKKIYVDTKPEKP